MLLFYSSVIALKVGVVAGICLRVTQTVLRQESSSEIMGENVMYLGLGDMNFWP